MRKIMGLLLLCGLLISCRAAPQVDFPCSVSIDFKEGHEPPNDLKEMRQQISAVWVICEVKTR